MPDEVGVMKSKMVFYFSKCPASCGGKEFPSGKEPSQVHLQISVGLEVVCFVEHAKDAPQVLWYYTIVKIKLWDIPSVIHINN
jgi:hypothetical protein